jgi:hypothetical protein
MVDGSLEPTKYDVSKTWWAREDSNLQTDRYERGFSASIDKNLSNSSYLITTQYHARRSRRERPL